MEVFVMKVGGSILAELPKAFYDMIVQLKKTGRMHPVIVHGGGPEINQALAKMDVQTKFIDGLRVTTKEVLEVAESVMSGKVNKEIVTKLHQSGGSGIGLSGVDGGLLKVRPADTSGKLGYVGSVYEVETSWLKLIIENGGIPVISPIGIHESGTHYNVNGDVAAAAVAEALQAKFALISDIPGVLEEVNGKTICHSSLTESEIEEKIDSGIIYGGMIPKVRSAIKALTGGVKESVILNGLSPEDLRAYSEGKKAGTKVVLKEVQYV